MLKRSTQLLINRHRGHDPRIGGVTSIRGNALRTMKKTASQASHRKLLAGRLRSDRKLQKASKENLRSGDFMKNMKERSRFEKSRYG